MVRTLAEMLEEGESDSRFPPIPRGRYTLNVVDARYRESLEREDNTTVPPQVRIQFKVEDAGDSKLNGTVAFVNFYIDQNGRTWGYIRRGYRLLTGGDNLLDGFTDKYVTDDEFAQKFAVGVVGGTVDAAVGVRTFDSGDEVNTISRWYSS